MVDSYALEIGRHLMKILLTGASGLVGREVGKLLVKKGHFFEKNRKKKFFSKKKKKKLNIGNFGPLEIKGKMKIFRARLHLATAPKFDGLVLANQDLFDFLAVTHLFLSSFQELGPHFFYL